MDLDRATPDHTGSRRAGRQGSQGRTGPQDTRRPGDPPLIAQCVLSAGSHPDARLFAGPRGGRISTAVLSDATHWDDVTSLGHEHPRRHDLRHTGPTRFADAGVQPHALPGLAGHGSLTATQRYPRPEAHKITAVGVALSTRFNVLRAPRPPSSPLTRAR
ncbi:tyrosine-type recombinase/integrase [Streptomyces sp. NPDC057702]|uniref:tyrosine-type recombinase/integrase n=1 Tax=unclassified Streptomyces TaxID=2593676 RepID=UPI00369B3CB1